MSDSSNGKAPQKSSLLYRIKEFFRLQLWVIDAKQLRGVRKIGLQFLRILSLVIREALTDAITVRAHALTAVTVLSLVPLFAVVFVVAKGTGIWMHMRDNIIMPWLDQLGQMKDVAQYVLQYVENTNFNRLGIVGILVLFMTAINMMSQIEKAFNDLWRVKSGRTIVRKITDYTAILVFTPLLLVAAGYFQAKSSAWAAGIIPQDWMSTSRLILSKLLSYLLFWAGFSFLFIVMPHRKIPILPAIVAGVITGTMYRIGLYLFIAGQIGVARYSAIYSSVAALPITVVWIDVSWTIVLIGCELAYAISHFNYFVEAKLYSIRRVSQNSKETIALRLLLETILRFQNGDSPPVAEKLAQEWKIPENIIEEAKSDLIEAKLVYETKEGALLPSYPPEKLTIANARAALANIGEQVVPADDPLWEKLKEAMAKTREGSTFATIIEDKD